MDKETLDLLKEMNLEMKSMNSDIGTLKSEMQDMNSDMGSLKSEMQDMNSDMGSLKSEMEGMNSDIHSLKSDMHHRFDTIDAKLEGVGKQFESTNESRIDEMEFIVDKVYKMEKDLYTLKNRSSD